MNREQAAAFILAINAAQPYVPPIIFQAIISSPACNTLVAVAGGTIELHPAPPLLPDDMKTG